MAVRPSPGNVKICSVKIAPPSASPMSLGRAFRAGGADEVLVERLHHVRTDHARVERREQDRERHPRKDQVVGPLHHSALLARRGVQDRRVSRDRRVDREVTELVAEEVGEDQADPDRVRGHADQDEDHAGPV